MSFVSLFSSSFKRRQFMSKTPLFSFFNFIFNFNLIFLIFLTFLSITTVALVVHAEEEKREEEPFLAPFAEISSPPPSFQTVSKTPKTEDENLKIEKKDEVKSEQPNGHNKKNNKNKKKIKKNKINKLIKEEKEEEAMLKAGRPDYSSVREDFLCRACVAVTSAFFQRILQPSTKIFHRQISGAEKNRKEFMIAEVHDAMDRLCEMVKATHAEEIEKNKYKINKNNNKNNKNNEKEEETRVPLGGSKRNLYDGIDAACPTALELLSDAFTETAFNILLPKKNSENSKTSKPSETHSETNVEEKKSEEKNSEKMEKKEKKEEETLNTNSLEKTSYRLPKAGVFCEEQQLCSPYLHYHITSEEDVNRRREMAVLKEKLAKLREHDAKVAREQEKNKELNNKNKNIQKNKKKIQEETYREAGFNAEEQAAFENAIRREKKSNLNDEEEENPSFFQLLTHPIPLFTNAVHILSEASEELCSKKFWRMQFQFLLDDAFWFHFSPQQKYLLFGTIIVLLLSLLMSTCLLCICCVDSTFIQKRNESLDVKRNVETTKKKKS